MKVIKPHRLGLLTRAMTGDGRRYQLAIAGIVSIPMAKPRALRMEIALWQDVADHIPGGMLDEANAKSRGEVLVCGNAMTRGGEPARAVMARLSVERDGQSLIDKKVAVQGDRFWKGSSPSEAQPFTELPLDWEHAFGGEGFEPNPTGKGAIPLETEHGPVQPLPNVEDPQQLVTSPDDRPLPAGLGMIDLTWTERFQHAGTVYDQEWLQKRFPGPAVDFDPRFYQAALPDQQIDGLFRGDETISVEGMHPTGTVSCTLEPLVVKAMATQRVEGAEATFTSVELSLETIIVLPNVERIILIHRGLLPVAGDDADDVDHLMLAAEDPSHPKSLEHYQHVLANRLDKERGALVSLKDSDLMPPATEGWLSKPDYGDMAEKTRLESRGLQKAEKGRRKKLEAAKAALEEAGFEVPDDFMGPDAPDLPDPYDVDAVLALREEMMEQSAKMEAQAEADQKRMEEEARASFAEAGMDWDAEKEKASTGGPPEFRADAQLIMLHDMARIATQGGMPMEELERDLLDPKYAAMLRALEEQVQESYRLFAHVMPAAALPDEARRQQLRVIVTAAHDSDEPLAGRNLTGADLHGLDLTGANLAGAFLERADLSGADLSGADLSGAVLSRADLAGTVFRGANLTGANLGDAQLIRTDFSSANLTDAVLMKSVLDGVLLHGARLDGSHFLEVTFKHADFAQAEAKQALFLQTDLRRVSFAGAKMVEARFVQVDLRRVNFTAAVLDRAQFIQCQGDDTIFDGASLVGATFVHETTFLRAGFVSADLTAANFHKCPLREADFEDATLSKANLIKADLRGANLCRVVGHEILAMRADLRGADLRGADMLNGIFQMADVRGADLRGSSFSRGDLSLAHFDGDTQLDDMLLVATRVDPKREKETA